MTLHTHTFLPTQWPFDDAINTVAFTTTRVLRDGYPVLLVSHDHEGDWQFLCGTTNESEDDSLFASVALTSATTALVSLLIFQ